MVRPVSEDILVVEQTISKNVQISAWISNYNAWCYVSCNYPSTKWSPFCHYSDVIWTQWRLKSPASLLFAQPLVQAHIKENIKAPRHWPLWGESIGDRWLPLTKGQWRGKFDDVFMHKTFSNSFHCMMIVVFRFKFQWNLFTKVQFAISEHWFR